MNMLEVGKLFLSFTRDKTTISNRNKRKTPPGGYVTDYRVGPFLSATSSRKKLVLCFCAEMFGDILDLHPGLLFPNRTNEGLV